MTWRDDKPTYKQLNFIKDIEAEVGEKFVGTTKGEAAEYIDKWAKYLSEDIDRNYDWNNECSNG